MIRFSLFYLLVIGCAPKGAAWKKANDADTARSWREFARVQPTHPRRPDALERIEELDWEAAITADPTKAPDAWTFYVDNHTGSPRIDDAVERREAARWAYAVLRDDTPAYERYLYQQPTGPNAPLARKRIDAIAWNAAVTKGTAAAYQQYLTSHPTGDQAASAVLAIEEATWVEAQQLDQYQGYVDALARYPAGRFEVQLEEALDGFRFNEVAVRYVFRSGVAPGAFRSSYRAVKRTLGPALKAQGFEVVWLDPVDATTTPDLDARFGFTGVPDGAGVLVLEVTQKPGRPFEPYGAATDVTSRIDSLAPGRWDSMTTWRVSGSTGNRVVGTGPNALREDAERVFAEAVAESVDLTPYHE